jgi:hypothetical protein
MKLYLLTILLICSIPSFGQEKYADYVGFFKKTLTKTQFPLQHSGKGIKSITWYSCSDTVFATDKCNKSRSLHFYSGPDLVVDTLFTAETFTSTKIKITNPSITATVTSFDNNGRKQTGNKDSLIVNKLKDPVELYENNELKTSWTYDSNNRIIGKIDNINKPDRLKTTRITYDANTIVESIETKEPDGVWNRKYEMLFDAKSKYIVRENIYSEKLKFLSVGKTIDADSVIHHEPLALSRHTVYNHEPSGVTITYFDNKTHLLTEKRKHDRKNRIVFQCSLNEKGDTLSWHKNTYTNNRIVSTHFQDSAFSEQTTTYFDNKGLITKKVQRSADPEIRKQTDYDESGIIVREIDINYAYRSMNVAKVER